MRRLLKFFAWLSFAGDCVSALGTVYPEWEKSYGRYKQRLDDLKTPEEREQEAKDKAEAEAEYNRKIWEMQHGSGVDNGNNNNPNVTVDVPYQEVKQSGNVAI